MNIAATQLGMPTQPTGADWELALERYTCGSCADLAWAFHELLGHPFRLIENEAAGHAVVIDDEGMVIDITGRKPLDIAMDNWGFDFGQIQCELVEVADDEIMDKVEAYAHLEPFDAELALHWARLVIANDFRPIDELIGYDG